MDSRQSSGRPRRRPLINRHALTDTTHASDALGVLGAIVHPLGDAARLAGTVYRGGRRLGGFEVVTDEDATAMQANVDLARFGPGETPRPDRGRGASGGDGCGCDRDGPTEAGDEPRLAVKPGGYLVLHVSWGAPGYRVTLAEPAEKEAKTVFDSARLGSGDLFALTLLRPGRYAVRVGKGEGRGEIRVAYPAPGRKARKAEAPARVALEDGELRPAEVEVDPAQGVVFEIRDQKTAIAVELTDPDDGPAEGKTKGPAGPETRLRRRTRRAPNPEKRG